jgi:hypothetical protein
LVKMRLGHSSLGIVVKTRETTPIQPVRYIKVYWSDAAACSVEAQSRLELIHESR